MDKQEKQEIRQKVWEKLKNVALPDSRFHLNFEEYIPDFKDSINAHNEIIKSKEYKESKLLFITFISKGEIEIILALDKFFTVFLGENLFIKKP